jgi:hypothetical protein
MQKKQTDEVQEKKQLIDAQRSEIQSLIETAYIMKESGIKIVAQDL